MSDQEATMPEPQEMTLAEAMSIYGLTAFYNSNLWTVGVIHLISLHDPSRYSHSWQPVATGATWMEAVSAAVRQKVVERDDKAELVEAVREWVAADRETDHASTDDEMRGAVARLMAASEALHRLAAVGEGEA